MPTAQPSIVSSSDDPVVIVEAKRTAIGKFGGGLSSLPASRLGALTIKNALSGANLEPGEVDEVIMGQVLTAATGQNPARQSAMDAGIPEDKTAFCVNQVCGSGLRSVSLGAQSILSGDANIIVAGGQENMSLAPHASHMRNGTKMGPVELVDTMIKDGLWDVFNDYHMGKTAENIALKYQITREDQDHFAALSQQKAEKALAENKFSSEIVPVTVRVKKDEVTVDTDEFPRSGVTAESLAGLKPAFKADGSVTPGNASGLNDGAAATVLMRASLAHEKNLKPVARIVSWATAGVDPSLMGTGPVPASLKALEKAGWDVKDLDLVESNEAFAAQSCCVIKELGLDPDIVNVNGGAIALGHPIGASGTRILVTLLHEMERRQVEKGLATLCIGGGMGIAMCVARDKTMAWREAG